MVFPRYAANPLATGFGRAVRLFAVAVAVAIAGTVTVAGSAYAHQQKAAITQVLFNPRTGNIEVSHRFYLHDAEHAVRLLFADEADIFGSKDTQAAFADYVAATFQMATEAGEALPLQLLGYEIERQFLWVYQEVPAPAELESLVLLHQSLTGIWPDQLNTVNVERSGAVQTVTFTGDSQPGRVTVKRVP